jgi:hypothetical protein
MSAHTAETAVQPYPLRQREKGGVENATTLEVGVETAPETEREANQGIVAHPVARGTHPGVHAEHPITVPEDDPGLPNTRVKGTDQDLEAAVVETPTLEDQEVEGVPRVEGELLPLRPGNHSALTSSRARATGEKRVDSVTTSLRAEINRLRLAVVLHRL